MDLFKKIKKSKDDEIITKSIHPKIKLKANLVFRLCKFEERFCSLIRAKPEKEKEANYFESVEEFEFFNLLPNEIIFFENIKMFKLTKNLENIFIKELILKSVGCFNFSNVNEEKVVGTNYKSLYNVNYLNINIETLSLHNLYISFSNLNLLMNYCKPKKLVLNKVDIADFNIKEFSKFTCLKSLNIFHSNISNFYADKMLGLFNLQDFHFQTETNCVTVYSTDYPFGYFYLYNFVPTTIPSRFNSISCLSLSAIKDISIIKEFPRCFLLSLTKIELELSDFDDLKHLNLIKLKLNQVAFIDAIVFYKIISKNSKTLKYLELKDCMLPLNTEDFCKQTLKNCKFILNDKKIQIP